MRVEARPMMRMGRGHGPRAVVGLVLCGLSRLFAQSASGGLPVPPPTDSQAGTATLYIDSRLIVLDVVVTDKNGHIVGDLTRDDFIVTEDKIVQTVRSFETPEEHKLPDHNLGELGASGVQNYGESPMTIFILDELSTKFEDMAYARHELKLYLDRQPEHLAQPSMLLAVGNKKLIPLTGWTQTRDTILEALSKRRPDVPYRIQGNGGGDITAAAERLSDSLAALSQLSQAYAGEHGKKNVIWLGHGFPSLNLENISLEEAEAITSTLHSTAALLIDNRVTVYTIDPMGLPTYGASAVDSTGAVPPDLTEPDQMMFESLTDQTGGRSYRLRNDIDMAIATALQEGSTYYTMTYAPSNHNFDGKYRQILVTIKRPGLTAHTRAGYFADKDHVTPPAMVGFELSKASQSDLPYTGLLISASDIQERSVVGGHAVFRLKVDPQGLTWRSVADGDRVTQFMLAITFMNTSGSVLQYKVKELATTANANKADAIMHSPLQYAVPVDLPLHTTHMRVIVRDDITGRIGSADLNEPALRALLGAKRSRSR
jgi:VWFA-related protein